MSASTKTLLVDDSEISRKPFVKICTRAASEVIETLSGTAGLASAKKDKNIRKMSFHKKLFAEYHPRNLRLH